MTGSYHRIIAGSIFELVIGRTRGNGVAGKRALIRALPTAHPSGFGPFCAASRGLDSQTEFGNRGGKGTRDGESCYRERGNCLSSDVPKTRMDAVSNSTGPGSTIPATASATKRFCLILVKPSHYDDDGYVIQWFRSTIPSNSLAAVYGLARDCAQ